MLFLTDNLLIKATDAIKKYDLGIGLHYKLYTVADTTLTYRQVNSLDTDKLLDDKRKSNKEWRKFSFKELVYFDIVTDLKKFGLQHKQLIELSDSFFKSKPKDPLAIHQGLSTIAITCVLGGVEITLCLDSEGKVNYLDPNNSLIFSRSTVPLIRLSLNEYVNRLVKSIQGKTIPVAGSLQDLILNKLPTSNSEKEEKLLEIIRNSEFTSITVKKVNGELSVVYAEKHNKEGNINISQLEKLIEAKDYQNVELVKRDGQIVNYKIEETFKL